MLAKMKRPFEATSREQIQTFEIRQGVVLPADYKDFLLRNNGGRPEPDSFNVPTWVHVGSVVDRFFGIKPGDDYDLEREYEVYAERIPAELIPIANDAFGNAICLGVKGKYRGKMYFWDHEAELDENGRSRRDYGNVYLLANSLDEFLSNLFESKDE